jgi:hypothetical protein
MYGHPRSKNSFVENALSTNSSLAQHHTTPLLLYHNKERDLSKLQRVYSSAYLSNIGHNSTFLNCENSVDATNGRLRLER